MIINPDRVWKVYRNARKSIYRTGPHDKIASRIDVVTPEMATARRFRISCQEVRDIINERRRGQNKAS